MLISKIPPIFLKVAEYVLYLFLVVFPFLNFTSFLYFGSVTRSINVIFVASVLSVVFGIGLLYRSSEMKLSKSKILWVLFSWLLLTVITAFFGNSFETSFFSNITRTTGLWFLFSLGIIGLILIKLFESKKVRDRMIATFVLSTVVFSIFSALGPEGLGWFFGFMKTDGFTFGNSTFAGMYIFAGFLLSVAYWFINRFRWWKVLLSVCIIFNPYIINFGNKEATGVLSFLGEARASALTLFFSIVILLFSFFISRFRDISLKKKIAFSSVAAASILLVVGAISFVSKNGFLREMYLSQATGARPLVWEISGQVIKESPYLGFGIENFEKVFETHYDNRILENRFGSEPWFDRAHNVFIDQLLEQGAVGLTMYLLLFILTCFILLKVCFGDTLKENKVLAFILLSYLFFHLLELQTSFDTSISYVILCFIFALSIALEREVLDKNESSFSHKGKNLLAVGLILWGVVSMLCWFIPFVRSGIVNGKIREVGSAEKRLPLYNTLFATPVDLQAVLWRTLTDFQRGISENPKVLEDPKKVAFLQKELERFESEYTKYVENNPGNFRALLNFADAKIYFMLFGVNKLDEAHLILDKAIRLVPQAPQPYRMKAVAYLYMQDFNKAREFAKKALDLNPRVEETQKLVNYIEDSIKTFPEIDLYFFKQI